MTVPIERKILLGFGVTLLVMLFAGGAAWWNLRRFESTFLLVDHTHQVLNHLERSITGVLTMQTSTRGFVLTGDERMLDPYVRGGVQVTESLQELRSLTHDNAAQQARLDRLSPVVESARSIMAGRITARREHGLGAVSDTAAFVAGQEAVERFRDLIEEMAKDERWLLNARVAASQAASRSTLTTIVAACTAATIFVVLAGGVVRHDFQRRREAEEALRVLNEQLEARVVERTMQLENANVAMRREIADRERAQAAVLASEKRLRATLDTLLEGCQIISPEFRYIYLNDTAANHGRSRQQALLGRTMSECYPGIEHTPVYAAIRACLGQRTTARMEQLFTYPDGTQAWFLLSIQPTPEGAAVLSIDITESKLLEQRIRQDNTTLEQRVRERTVQLETVNRELEAFSYSVSHDLRAPLRHVDGFSNLLRKHAAATLDEKGLRFLATISTSARQMGRLIDDLLAFSRIGRTALKLQPVNHTAVVAGAIADGRYEQAGRAITWEVGPLPTVPGDPAMLRQVWVNLLDNAVKYTGKQPHPKISIAAREDIAKREWMFSICDNGVGFDMAYVEKLFGVFQRLHGPAEFEGTGIGLANIRRIILRHSGRVWAEGRVGEGASFFFTLPFSPEPPPPVL